MENEKNNGFRPDSASTADGKDRFLGSCILLAAIILAGAWIYTAEPGKDRGAEEAGIYGGEKEILDLKEKVMPSGGVTLPVKWGDLGLRLTQAGVIDGKKFEMLYQERGKLNDEVRQLLYGSSNGAVRITAGNADVLLNFFWALGLGNKNEILEKGPMQDPRYGGAGNFASTGGWILAQGNSMDHYSKHALVALNMAQQALVERVSKNVYRSCCDNSTYFPDCNHGMAMLGLLQLMSSQGVSEQDLYRTALQVNAYWFPDTYLTIARFLESKGILWDDVDPKEILGRDYSSASGYRQVLSQVKPSGGSGGSGCGV